MRTYGDVCGVARALDLVGERWALMIVRELLLGPKRFTDLRTGLPHLSADVLTQRLRELGEAGIVARRRLPPPAASQVYELTGLGLELEPVVLALGRFGALLPVPTDDVRMSFDSHLLTLTTLFDPGLADGFAAVVELRLGEERFRAEVVDGRFAVARGDAPDAAAVVATDPGTLVAVVHGRRALDEARRSGDLEVGGDEAVVERFVGLFPLPDGGAQPASSTSRAKRSGSTLPPESVTPTR